VFTPTSTAPPQLSTQETRTARVATDLLEGAYYT
jgi:hypothetical protein